LSFDKITSHSARKCFSGFDFFDNLHDFIFVIYVSDTIFYDEKCFIDEDSRVEECREEFAESNEHLFFDDVSEEKYF